MTWQQWQPDSEKAFVPVERSVPIEESQVAPWRAIPGSSDGTRIGTIAMAHYVWRK